MPVFKRILLLGLPLLLLYVGYVLASTGFFRTVDPKFAGKVLQEIALKGAEDMTISRVDSFVLISSTNRLVYPPTEEERGGLYRIDLRANDYQPIPLTADLEIPFAPHGISYYKKDSTYQVMAINHTDEGHSIEVFELDNQTLRHVRTLTHPSMVRPNDLVLVGDNQFYFTNDHGYTQGMGKLAEEYLGLAVSYVVHFSEGEYREVARGIAYASGINYDRARNLLYVASPRHFLVKVYAVKENGSLSFVENISCGTGVDNIEFDQAGNLWMGAHPNLLWFNAYAKGKKETSPSEIIKVTYAGEGDYAVEKVFVSKGERMSASSVAAVWGNLIFAGNVMDDGFLILERDHFGGVQ